MNNMQNDTRNFVCYTMSFSFVINTLFFLFLSSFDFFARFFHAARSKKQQQQHRAMKNIQLPTIIPVLAPLESASELSTCKMFGFCVGNRDGQRQIGYDDDIIPGVAAGILPDVDDGVLPLPGVTGGILPGVDEGVLPDVDDGVLPGVIGGTLPGVDEGVLPGVDDGVLPGVAGGILPGVADGILPGVIGVSLFEKK